MKKVVTVKLEPLNQNNWEECANLKVGADQEDSLPSNIFSIAELNFYPQTKAVAILNEEEQIVGFATFGIPKGESISKIFRLMIDKKFQGKGYGRSALIQIVTELFKNGVEDIEVCYHPQKEELKQFYGSIGFKEREILPCEGRIEGKRLAVLSRNDFHF